MKHNKTEIPEHSAKKTKKEKKTQISTLEIKAKGVSIHADVTANWGPELLVIWPKAKG